MALTNFESQHLSVLNRVAKVYRDKVTALDHEIGDWDHETSDKKFKTQEYFDAEDEYLNLMAIVEWIYRESDLRTKSQQL